MADTFDLVTNYLQLEDGPAARRIPVDAEFWAKIDQRPELSGGRLLGVFPYERDWSSWEMHPAGDELVYLLAGAVELVLEEPGGERRLALRAGDACIVPRGIWHTANVQQPGSALHVTRGEGTRHRPR